MKIYVFVFLMLIHHIGSFAQKHPLYANVDLLHKKIDAGKKAIADKNSAIRAEKMAEAEVDIDKEVMIRQYENNYLDAQEIWKTCSRKVVSRNTTTQEPGGNRGIG